LGEKEKKGKNRKNLLLPGINEGEATKGMTKKKKKEEKRTCVCMSLRGRGKKGGVQIALVKHEGRNVLDVKGRRV